MVTDKPMHQCTDMTKILDIESPDIDMSPALSEKSATELMEQEIKDSEQVNRAYDLFQRMLAEGRKKEATKTFWYALLNYNVDFSND